MSCDLLLIHPPSSLRDRYGPFAEMGNRVPPLGLALLASLARQAGFSAEILDAAALDLSIPAILRAVREARPRFVGLTAVSLSIKTAFQVAEAVKTENPETLMLLGGPHLSALPEETMKECPSFDIGVIGEGEGALPEILSGKKPRDIQGIIYREEEALHQTPPREPLLDLDRLPFPAWDLLPPLRKYYRPALHSYLALPSSSLVTSRGCPARCVFCTRYLNEAKYRAHSAEYVLEMIETLVRNYGIQDIMFSEDNFLFDRERVFHLSELLIRKNIRISWSCLARPEIVPTELLRNLKRSGCWQIAYGIESGDQEILNGLKKSILIEQAAEVLKKTRKIGIRTRGYFMLGSPGETEESLNKTRAFALKADLDDMHATLFTPFPGTEIYNEVERYGVFRKDFSAMNGWTPIFIPKALTEELLIRHHRKIHRDFYLRPKVLGRHLLHLLRSLRSLPAYLGAARHLLSGG